MGVNGIYGLSGSGIDVESMVKVGMMSKQNEYDKMYKKETKMEWQKEAYSGVYTDLMNFNVSKLSDYKMQSKMNAMTATTNNTSAFSVSANGSAVVMSHRVEVNELSSNAYLMSTGSIERANAGAADDSVDLKDSVFQSLTDNGDGTFSVTFKDGTTQTVNEGDEALSFTVNDGVSKLEAKDRTIKFSYRQLADGASFNDLASKIKGLNLNVTATYDSVNDSFSLYNSKGGTDNKISLTMGNAATADLFNNMKLGQSKEGVLEPAQTFSYDSGSAEGSTTEIAGSNGKITIDGREYTNITDNKITVGGVTYTLMDKTTSAAIVTVSQDQESIIDRVKQFV
ncbi:MAG: flagellar hook protein, partial [Selenomonadaceae bacterium]|nr:flagellar hook protein [Selenomonadaceae bacterium]